MRRKTKKYSLMPSVKVTSEGSVSIYRVLRDSDTFTDELMQKYTRDVRELLNAKLDRLVSEYKVSQKEIQRIKELVVELEKVAEAKC